MTDRLDPISIEAPSPDDVSDAPGDADESKRQLHLPLEEGQTDDDSQVSEKDLLVFCQTGLLPVAPSTRPVFAPDLIPAILHPYVGTTFRRPWPLVVDFSKSGPVVHSLTSVTDTLIEAIADEGDDAERLKRGYLKVEHLLSQVTLAASILESSKALDEAGKQLKKEKSARKEQQEVNVKALQDFRISLGENGLVVGYGEHGLRSLLEAVSVSVSDGRHRAFLEDIQWNASRLEDLLKVDDEDSGQGHTPEKLKKSVGGAYSEAIDFSSLSHLLDEAPHGASIDSDRRSRIEQTISELADLSGKLYGDDRRVCFLTVSSAYAALKSRVADFTRLARAKQIARLEAENRYRPEIHDPLFDAFGYESIPASERKAFPPVLVHLHDEEIEGADILIRAMGEAGIMRMLVTFSSLFDWNAVPSLGMNVAHTVVARGDVYVQQSSAAAADYVGSGMQLSARERGSSLLSVYVGTDSLVGNLDAFMSVALAADSRTVPSFRFDPDKGADWADRFSASENEQPESKWASEPIAVRHGEEVAPLTFTTTPADVLSIDPRFSVHYLPVDPGFESGIMEELPAYLELEQSFRSTKLPFIWMRDGESKLIRVLVGPTVVRAADSVRNRWKMIQEWSGLDSSILKRGLKDQEAASKKHLDEATAKLKATFEQQMNETTGSLAQQIVQNIAASLLGLHHPETSHMGMPPLAPKAPVSSPENASGPSVAPPATKEEDPQPDVASPVEQEEEEDLGISLDEAYIDTPLCTSCNECTDLNSMIFGYNSDKQAFIKDAAAGPYRDLVLAAEKCPVRIIHPGKPGDPSEKFLDEWIERAKPFL